MDISTIDIIVFSVLLVSGSIGYIVALESSRPRWDGIILFMGKKGRGFLIFLMIVTLPIFLASAIYLGFSAWILCVTGIVLNFIINRSISPYVLRFVIGPIYGIYSIFYRENEDDI
jgi:hypothetical protein